MASPYKKIPKTMLPHILAQIVDFHLNDYTPFKQYPDEDTVMNIAYICSCFMAQNIEDTGGVDTETSLNALMINKVMPYSSRLELAKVYVDSFDNSANA